MAKIKILFVLCWIGLASSCINELETTIKQEGLDENGEAAVSLSVVSPAIESLSLRSRATSAGEMRFVLELYDKTETENYVAGKGELPVCKKHIVETFTKNSGTWNVDFRIAPGEYTVIAWADAGETYYETSSLLAVKAIRTDELTDNRDAYKAIAPLTVGENATARAALTLKHATAKVAVRTTDIFTLYADYSGEDGWQPGPQSVRDHSIATAAVTYSQIDTQLNLLTGETSEPLNRPTLVETDFDYTNPSLDLITDYIFSRPETTGTETIRHLIPQLEIKVTMDDGTNLMFTLTDVPLSPCHTTLLYGNLLMGNTEIEITIDDEWGTGIEELFGGIHPITDLQYDPATGRYYIYLGHPFYRLLALGKSPEDRSGNFVPEGSAALYPGTGILLIAEIQENKTPYERKIMGEINDPAYNQPFYIDIYQPGGAITLTSDIPLQFAADETTEKIVTLRTNAELNTAPGATLLTGNDAGWFTITSPLTLTGTDETLAPNEISYTYTIGITAPANDTRFENKAKTAALQFSDLRNRLDMSTAVLPITQNGKDYTFTVESEETVQFDVMTSDTEKLLFTFRSDIEISKFTVTSTASWLQTRIENAGNDSYRIYGKTRSSNLGATAVRETEVRLSIGLPDITNPIYTYTRATQDYPRCDVTPAGYTVDRMGTWSASGFDDPEEVSFLITANYPVTPEYEYKSVDNQGIETTIDPQNILVTGYPQTDSDTEGWLTGIRIRLKNNGEIDSLVDKRLVRIKLKDPRNITIQTLEIKQQGNKNTWN